MRSSIVAALGCLGLVACSVGDYDAEPSGFGAGGPVGAAAGEPGDSEMMMTSMTGPITGGDTGGETGVTTGPTSGPTGPGETTDASDSGLSGATSELPPGCGNGQVDPGEACDDGNQVDDDTCRNDCAAASCGDGVVLAGVEGCDDGNMIETDACRSTCVPAACGDGVVQAGVEGCDDGNQNDADGCSNSCKAGSCGDGVVQPGEQCDDGNANNLDACLNACKKATCGDGVAQAGVEQCDAGGASQQCNANCTLSKCGDAQVNVAAGEQCDTAGQSATCDGDCTSVVCGDNKINPQAGEQCDDGNVSGGDGCSAACKMEQLGPKQCDQGTDPGTGAPWVVCSADANTAWISANPEGGYHMAKICQNLGYNKVGQWGGTCGGVCGFCQNGTSCQNPGPAVFSEGVNQNYNNCGQDGLGPITCKWVMWTCVK